MAKLDKKAIRKYLGDPNHCPYCGSLKIATWRIEVDGGTAWSRVKCDICLKEWMDVYTLTDIEEA